MYRVSTLLNASVSKIQRSAMRLSPSLLPSSGHSGKTCKWAARRKNTWPWNHPSFRNLNSKEGKVMDSLPRRAPPLARQITLGPAPTCSETEICCSRLRNKPTCIIGRSSIYTRTVSKIKIATGNPSSAASHETLSCFSMLFRRLKENNIPFSSTGSKPSTSNPNPPRCPKT